MTKRKFYPSHSDEEWATQGWSDKPEFISRPPRPKEKRYALLAIRIPVDVLEYLSEQAEAEGRTTTAWLADRLTKEARDADPDSSL